MGDLCAVLCKKGTGGAGLPSKTWSIMGCGRPLLLSFDEGELQQTVQGAKAGLCAPAEDVEALVSNIKRAKNDPSLCREMGENARAYAIERAGREQGVKKYIDLIRQTVGR